jgi:hypothetical protein
MNDAAGATTGWLVVVFGYSGDTRRWFPTEMQAQVYARSARRAGCLARVEVAS